MRGTFSYVADKWRFFAYVIQRLNITVIVYTENKQYDRVLRSVSLVRVVNIMVLCSCRFYKTHFTLLYIVSRCAEENIRPRR